jgi:homoserine kinase type II
MATYTQLNQAQIQVLADHYDLPAFKFEPLNGGNGNSSYLLYTQNTTYVLTVCDDKVYDEVFKMGQLLLLLEANNIPCTRLIKQANNDILTTYQDKAVMLKGYIQGEVIEVLNAKQMLSLGCKVARLNQIPAPDYMPTDHPYGRSHFIKAVGTNIDVKYEALLHKEMAYLAQNISDELPRGLIHGDLFNDNMLFEQGQFKAIIDFEEACHYYFVFELGMAIVGCCVTGTIVDLKRVRALVDGYQQVRSLQEIEKQSLQMFIHYAAVATSYWRFNQYNVENPCEDKAGHHWQMVKVAVGVAEVSKAGFYERVFG